MFPGLTLLQIFPVLTLVPVFPGLTLVPMFPGRTLLPVFPGPTLLPVFPGLTLGDAETVPIRQSDCRELARIGSVLVTTLWDPPPLLKSVRN